MLLYLIDDIKFGIRKVYIPLNFTMGKSHICFYFEPERQLCFTMTILYLPILSIAIVSGGEERFRINEESSVFS